MEFCITRCANFSLIYLYFVVMQHQVPFSSLCFSTVFFFILFLLFVQFVSCRFVFVFCGSINAEILLVYNDTRVKRSEIRCNLACEKIFDLLAPASYNMTGTEAAYYTDLAAALFRPSLFWTLMALFLWMLYALCAIPYRRFQITLSRIPDKRLFRYKKASQGVASMVFIRYCPQSVLTNRFNTRQNIQK